MCDRLTAGPWLGRSGWLVLIWLPVSAHVSRQAAWLSGLATMATYLAIYCAAALGAIALLLAHRPIVVVLSFLAICVAVILLIASNLVIRTSGGGNAER